MRLIDADALSDILEQMIEVADIKSRENVMEPVVAHHFEMLKQQIEEILTGVSEFPTIESEPRWIPTSKERPPQHQEIWITSDLGDVELVYGKDGIWLLDEGYYTESEIIAWMPLPSPYRPEEEGEQE